MNRVAIIDIGSNTIHLDVFAVTGRVITKIASRGTVITLGVYLTGSNMIPRRKIEESAAAIDVFLKFAKKNGAATTHVFATSILRKAANTRSFLRAIKKQCGIDVDVISGQQECQCIERAARFFMPQKGRNLLVDIGGGSTEFILFDTKKTYVRKSYAYGLSKVKGAYNISLSSETCVNKTLEKFFDAKAGLFLKGVVQYKFEKIIVTSSVAKIMTSLKYGGMVTVSDCDTKKITYADLSALQHTLLTQPRAVRLAFPQTELVYIGTYFFMRLLRKFKKRSFFVGPFSAREGYLLGVINAC